MKKLGLLVFGFALVMLVVACTKNDVNAFPSYLVVDINPSIEFILNEDEEVVSFNLLNEDAEIVAGDIDFTGMAIEDALELFLETAMELGYIDVTRDDNVILITLVNDDDTQEGRIRNRMINYAEGFLVKHRIGGVVMNSGLTHDEFFALAEEYGVSPGKLRIAWAASDIDVELTLEAALEMSVADLMVIIRADHQARMLEFKAERQEAARGIRNAMQAEAQDRVQNHMDNVPGIARQIIQNRMQNMRNEFNQDRQDLLDDYRARQAARKDSLRP